MKSIYTRQNKESEEGNCAKNITRCDFNASNKCCADTGTSIQYNTSMVRQEYGIFEKNQDTGRLAYNVINIYNFMKYNKNI